MRQFFNLDSKAVLTIAYSRVSSHDQKSDLVYQELKLTNFAKSLPDFDKHNFISITDLGSGLNYKKKGLKKLIHLIFSGQVKNLIINHKDRLLRFGSELIFYLCDLFNVNVIIVEQIQEQRFLYYILIKKIRVQYTLSFCSNLNTK